MATPGLSNASSIPSSNTEPTSSAPASAPAVDAANYELIRNRLSVKGQTLASQAEALNTLRQQVFPSRSLSLRTQIRVRTENNCLPRDIVALGDLLIFGYNVVVALRTQTTVADVFNVHRLEVSEQGIELKNIPLSEVPFLSAPDFVRDFDELYRYYRDTRLIHLQRTPIKLLMVFQTSPSARDLRVFRFSIEPSGSVRYIDNRGERDYVFPPSHDFSWTQTTRDLRVEGRHAHLNILNTLFVETIGGDLTLKVENNTESGQGIYCEPVEDAHQALDDADISYAQLGFFILLKIKPYRENAYRYLVFNTRTKEVKRIDAIGLSCIQLPNDHGIIFPGGYYLNTGELKVFAADARDPRYEALIRSPNGEDVLYAFYEHEEGRSILLPYNLIRKEISNPLSVHGYCLFDDGQMVVFKADSLEATRIHPMQLWQTPFVSDEFEATRLKDDSLLGRLGNPEVVRAISDCYTLRRMIDAQSPTLLIYEDLIAVANRTLDTYHWLNDDSVGNIAATLKEIRDTAEKVIDEFEKVLAIRKRSEEALAKTTATQQELLASHPGTFHEASQFIKALAAWRKQKGTLFSLRDLRYIDLEAISGLEAEATRQFDLLTKATVSFLLDEKALEPYKSQIGDLQARGEAATRSIDLAPMREEVNQIGEGFDLLTEIVSGLKVDDPTLRTRILERVSEIYSLLNRTKAFLDQAFKQFLGTEGVARFGVEIKLFTQSVSNALAMCQTPEKCDEQLSRLTVQLEELEARYGEFDQFLSELASRREEVLEAFEGKKRTLLEDRQRRAQNVLKAADRILAGIVRRAASFASREELNTFFVSDPMVAKVRDLAQSLRDLGEGMRADELLGKLKASTQEASRLQRDRADLFEGAENSIRLGRHRFTVTPLDLELTLMQREGQLSLHLTGTDFFEALESESLTKARPFWEQALISETEQIYRGEYLAAAILWEAEEGKGTLSLGVLERARSTPNGLLELIRQVTEARYDEGYERGVHDADTALILEALLTLRANAGLLRYAPEARALACLFWATFGDEAEEKRLTVRARSLGRLQSVFANSRAVADLASELGSRITSHLVSLGFAPEAEGASLAGAYLADELAESPLQFAFSKDALALERTFLDHLDRNGLREFFLEDLRRLEGHPKERHDLALAWLEAFLRMAPADTKVLAPVSQETAVHLELGQTLTWQDSSSPLRMSVTGLLGQHPRIVNRTLELRLDEFLARTRRYREVTVPAYRAWRTLRQEVLDAERKRLRLEEFRPKVLTSFVRNRLINDVYLPLIGGNLAKQIGALGAAKRTDLMGMLLLISPPGYGKTTLMEYVAKSLGLIFMKVNGPSLGHQVLSLDPAEAKSATARLEVEKLNLALEMGNNVMLYLDDIQHTNPEFLQKFISLCDATRRIEGVWKGRSRTYDLRGKRFCVVMAGNPYTESGEKFRIPDMLANRADTYNLGEVLMGKEEAFAMSYLENAFTSNAVLAPLTSREPADIPLLIRLAKGEEVDRTTLSYDYSAAELEEITAVLRKLLTIQEIVLAVNQQYIASASQADEYRTEPPFKLQGSYRNMNKMTEKVVAAMNEVELERVIQEHYQSEAQTLTTGAEQNLLKLAEIRKSMTELERTRWEEIKKSFGRLQMMFGAADDPVSRIMAPLSALVQEVKDVRTSIDHPVRQDLVKQVQALVGEVAASREGVRSSVSGQVAEPLRQLAGSVATAGEALRVAAGEEVATPLRAVVAALLQAQAEAAQRSQTDVAAPLHKLVQALEADRQTLQAAADTVSEPLRAWVKESAQGASSITEALMGPLGNQVGELGQQLAKSRLALRSAISEELAPPLSALATHLEGVAPRLEASLSDGVSRPLSALLAPMERTGQMLLALSQELNGASKGLLEQLSATSAGMQSQAGALLNFSQQVARSQAADLKAQINADAAVATQLGALLEELKQLRDGVRITLYKPLLALAHQAHALRKGLGDAPLQELLSRLEALVRNLNATARNMEVLATSNPGSTQALAAIAREMEELRYTMSAAIHSASPELSAKLDAMRNT